MNEFTTAYIKMITENSKRSQRKKVIKEDALGEVFGSLELVFSRRLMCPKTAPSYTWRCTSKEGIGPIGAGDTATSAFNDFCKQVLENRAYIEGADEENEPGDTLSLWDNSSDDRHITSKVSIKDPTDEDYEKLGDV